MNTPDPKQSSRDIFYIVDFDRTLADSDKLLDVFLGVAGQYLDIPRSQIDAADADVKARGDSFDTASYVRGRLDDQDEHGKWEQLEKQFIHESRAFNMLLPGAAELLAYFEEHNKRFGVLTYGNPLWQHLKLTASGFNHIRRIVLETKEKGKLVGSWQQDSGLFKLPQEFGGGEAQSIVMIDDKAVSFDGFPGVPSEGYYVVDLERILPSQEGSIPANVHHATNLTEVLTTIKQ
jgi:FMN phosphatase YigB (HAD superfamily)